MERVIAGLQQRRVDHREGEAHPRLPRGRPRADVAPDDEASPVQKVTIIARGTALGYTLNLPEEERYLHTKEELINWMVVLLAGRAAEQVVFGRVTNGAGERPREGDRDRPLDGLRVRHGRERRVAHDARRQLRALRGDQAAARPGAGAAHRPRLRRGDAAPRPSTARCSTASPRRCSSRRRCRAGSCSSSSATSSRSRARPRRSASSRAQRRRQPVASAAWPLAASTIWASR